MKKRASQSPGSPALGINDESAIQQMTNRHR